MTDAGNKVTVFVTVQATADIDTLRKHIGYTEDKARGAGFDAEVLYQHIKWPLEEPCFDTPATITVKGYVGEVHA